MEDEATDLWSLHNQTSLVLKEGERVQEERLAQLEAVEEELREAREIIDHLENELEKDCESRLNELDEERALLIDIINQLVGGNIEEVLRCTFMYMYLYKFYSLFEWVYIISKGWVGLGSQFKVCLCMLHTLFLCIFRQ